MFRQTDQMLLFRILAAQASEIQSILDQSTRLLVASLDRLAERAAAVGMDNPGVAELNDELSDLAFAQAQENDLLSQMIRGLGAALARLPGDIDIDDLAGNYISEHQRRIHQSVLEHSRDDD